MGGRLEARLRTWLERREELRLLMRWGGIQVCPWCRQVAQSAEGWHFKEWPHDPFLDVLTCGVCGGTSLWRFELGMMWIGPLDPPKPALDAVPHYDIAAARLLTAEDR